jgi:Family of unknown function (DUF5677)
MIAESREETRRLSIHRLSRAVTLYLGRVERAFTLREMFLRQSYSDVVLSAIFRHSMKTARAIVTLANSGFGSNALGLSRSVADEWLTIRWLTNREPEPRCKLFLGFAAKQRERIVDILDRHNANMHNQRNDLRRKALAAEYKRWDK